MPVRPNQERQDGVPALIVEVRNIPGIEIERISIRNTVEHLYTSSTRIVQRRSSYVLPEGKA